MATKPISIPLPADLPENWTTGQMVAPTGTEVGLSEQHGYNYLMEQVNAAQEALNTVNDAFEDLATTEDVGDITPSGIGAIPASEKGQANGVATLGSDGKVPLAQLAGVLLSVSAAAEYSASATYSAGDYCVHEGQLYKANQDISTAEPWTAAHWTATSIMAEIAALDYDPAGTAESAVEEHNNDPAAHPALQAQIAAALTATPVVSYS